MMAEEPTTYCNAHEDELFEELERVWDRPIPPDLMSLYVSGSSDGWMGDRPAKTAYCVGSRIVGDLVNDGNKLCELTRTGTEAILRLHGTLRG
jgi:hypothetical protein